MGALHIAITLSVCVLEANAAARDLFYAAAAAAGVGIVARFFRPLTAQANEQMAHLDIGNDPVGTPEHPQVFDDVLGAHFSFSSA